MKRVIAVHVMMLILTLNGPSFAAEGVSAGALIAKGDAAYKKFDNKAALQFYKTSLGTDPKNYEAAWKLARAYVDVGEKLSDKKERRSHYEKGYEYAKKAVVINPNGAKGHLFLSIAIGRIALDAGAKERVKLSKEVKSEVDKALAIDPQDDAAWHVLAGLRKNLPTCFLEVCPRRRPWRMLWIVLQKRSN
jgi:tetratricopeptide (TPR) repeat protein